MGVKKTAEKTKTTKKATATAASKAKAPAKKAAAKKVESKKAATKKTTAKAAETKAGQKPSTAIEKVDKAAVADKKSEAIAQAAEQNGEVTEQQGDESSTPSLLKLLIAKGKEQGYLTYAEVHDNLPSHIVEPDEIEEFMHMFSEMGIPVHETAPDADQLAHGAT